MNAEERAERERQAETQARVLQAINALNEHQRKRYEELAKVYEAMKAAAWLQLRQMKPNEVAHILIPLCRRNEPRRFSRRRLPIVNIQNTACSCTRRC